MKTLNTTEKMAVNSELTAHKTNHILHLILTILTAGVWSIIWIAMAGKTIDARNKIKKSYGMKPEFNTPSAMIGFVLIAIVLVIMFSQ